VTVPKKYQRTHTHPTARMVITFNRPREHGRGPWRNPDPKTFGELLLAALKENA